MTKNEHTREWFKKHPDYQKIWGLNNIEKLRACRKRSNAKRCANPVTNKANNIRRQINKMLKKLTLKKSNKTFNLLGYSKYDLHNHLSQWFNKPCMLCKNIILNEKERNYEVDHIIPIGSAEIEIDIIKLNQLGNLRLLCKKCNSHKIKEDISWIKKMRWSVQRRKLFLGY